MDWAALRGIFAVYKPVGPTSHDIIDQLRRLTGERRIGHAGTLDPLASGVLVVGVGREATKVLASHVAKDKEYLAEVRFGLSSTTDDADGQLTAWPVERKPTREAVVEAVRAFIGDIKQVPPAFSAIKKAGAKAYKLARAGKQVDLGARDVSIRAIEVVAYEWPDALLRVECGPGVYIRSLARDLGKELGVGGYIQALQRTRVGDFTLAEAYQLPQHRKEKPDLWRLKK